MPAKAKPAKDSIKRLRRSEHLFSLTDIKRLLEAREIRISVAMLSRIVSDDEEQRRDASDEVTKALDLLARELC